MSSIKEKGIIIYSCSRVKGGALFITELSNKIKENVGVHSVRLLSVGTTGSENIFYILYESESHVDINSLISSSEVVKMVSGMVQLAVGVGLARQLIDGDYELFNAIGADLSVITLDTSSCCINVQRAVSGSDRLHEVMFEDYRNLSATLVTTLALSSYEDSHINNDIASIASNDDCSDTCKQLKLVRSVLNLGELSGEDYTYILDLVDKHLTDI